MGLTCSNGQACVSNPVQFYAAPPERNIYWGDIHVHHGNTYTEDGVEIDENMVYAGDIIGLDIVSESMKGIPVPIDGDALWAQLQQTCVSATVPGEFLYLLGSEWMGDYYDGMPNQGHHNFYFDNCTAPVPHHYDEGLDDGILAFGSGLGPYEWAAEREAEGTGVVIIPHATCFTGQNGSAEALNNSLRTTAEVYSEWGFSLEPSTMAGVVQDGLANGHRMGFIAASDNHTGWMGNPFSTKSETGGSGAYVARSLTREDIFTALQTRSTYATTGARMLLDFAAVDGAIIASGQEYVAEHPTFTWSASGTATIQRIELVGVAIAEGAQTETLYTEELDALDTSGSMAWESWDGRDYAVWLVVTQGPDSLSGIGQKAWSSPI